MAASRQVLSRSFTRNLRLAVTPNTAILLSRHLATSSAFHKCGLREPVQANTCNTVGLKHWHLSPHHSFNYYTTDQEIELTWRDVGSTELKSMLDSGNIQLIDVREPYELTDEGIIDSRAVNVPLGELGEALMLTNEEFKNKYGAPKPSKEDVDIVFHCRAGVRSRNAIELANTIGYERARHYYPGFNGWKEFQSSN